LRQINEKAVRRRVKLAEPPQCKTQAVPQMLVIGDLQEWQAAGRDLPTGEGLFFANLNDISPEFLQTLAPDVVLSPMVARRFDCLDVAQVLYTSNFTGRFRVVAPWLPNPAVILAEVRSLCPGLDFDFMQIGHRN